MGNITICEVFADDAVGVRSNVLKEKKMEFLTVFLSIKSLGDTTKGSGKAVGERSRRFHTDPTAAGAAAVPVMATTCPRS